jgi:hypothetical protein
VVVVGDAALDVDLLAAAALDDRDAGVGLIGEDCLEAAAVVVGERKLGAGGAAARAARSAATPRPTRTDRRLRCLRDLAVVAHPAVLVERRNQSVLGNSRIAARTGSVSS